MRAMRPKSQSALLPRLREVDLLQPCLQREKRGRGRLQAIAAAFLATVWITNCVLDVEVDHGGEHSIRRATPTASQSAVVGQPLAAARHPVLKPLPGMRSNLQFSSTDLRGAATTDCLPDGEPRQGRVSS